MRTEMDNASTHIPRSNAAWGAVIDDVYKIDVRAVFQTLTEQLTVDWSAGVRIGLLYKLCNEADANSFMAAKLARAAKLEDERVKEDGEIELSMLRESARAELAEEKKEGKLSRAATIKDVEDRVRQRWPDRQQKIKIERAKMHGACRACEALLESWRERSRSIRAMLQGRRPSGV